MESEKLKQEILDVLLFPSDLEKWLFIKFWFDNEGKLKPRKVNREGKHFVMIYAESARPINHQTLCSLLALTPFHINYEDTNVKRSLLQYLLMNPTTTRAELEMVKAKGANLLHTDKHRCGVIFSTFMSLKDRNMDTFNEKIRWLCEELDMTQ